MMNICINKSINILNQHPTYDEHLYQQINQHSESTSYDEHLYQQILNQHPMMNICNQHPMMNICINKSINIHLNQSTF